MNYGRKLKTLSMSLSENVLGRLKGGQRKKWLTKDTITLAKERWELKPGKGKSAKSTKHYNYLCREIKWRMKRDYDV